MAEKVPAPRMLLLRWPFGNPFGTPDQPELQASVLHRALSMLDQSDNFGYFDDPGWRWKRTEPELPEDWVNSVKEFDAKP